MKAAPASETRTALPPRGARPPRRIRIAPRAPRDYALLMPVKLIALWSALAIVAMLAVLGVAFTVAGRGVDWGYGITALVMWWMTLCVAASGAVLMITGRW